MREWEISFLRRLRDASSDGIVKSSIPKRCYAIVEALRACAAAEYSPSAAGRGIRLVINSQSSFDRFVESRCPAGLDFEVEEIQNHGDAVAFLGDAKAFRHSIAEGVFVRATKPNVTIDCKHTGQSIPVSELTAITGCAAIQLCQKREWTFAGTLAIIENADAFWLHERVLPDVDIAVFVSGRMSGRLLDWLASPQLADCAITHWGDYDPVGVAEYFRLKTRCGNRVTAHVPEDLEPLLKCHGKRNLITDQAEILTRLRVHSSDAHVVRMIDIFDKHRKGLEQELLLGNR